MLRIRESEALSRSFGLLARPGVTRLKNNLILTNPIATLNPN